MVALPPSGFAQWMIYNFSPRAAFQGSMIYDTTAGTSGRVGGWPTNWNNSAAVGVLALQFTTNTNSPNVITALEPIVYIYNRSFTNTNAVLTTNNYETNLAAYLGLTNTNTGGLSTNVWFFNRSSNGPLMAGQYQLAFTNTNTAGNFLARLQSYTTNQIGTNGFNTNLTRFPPLLNLRIFSMENLTNPSVTTNRQLSLPLTLNLSLTKIVNTNTNFYGSLTNSAILRSNLPRLIRSNSLYISNL